MNGGTANNMAGLTIYASVDLPFSIFSTVGTFSISTAGQNRIDFTQLASGEFVRLNWSSLQGGFRGLNEFIAGGVASDGAVPEPAVWPMMLIGYGAFGVTLRRRSNISVTVKFA
jgi:hypothetical protein